jgi:Zn-dependent M16 (insulinase) family peptidase
MDKKDYSKFSKKLKPFLNKLPRGSGQKQNYRFETKAQNEGLSTPGKVQYVVQGYNFKKLGFQYTGAAQVFQTIIRLDYLWNRLRVQGGAYGAIASFSRTGNAFFASYRDPNLKETLAVYDTMADYLKKFSVSSREMTKYIIGTISKVDSPLTPSMKGGHATANYLCKITERDIQRERDEILKTKQKDIRDMAEMVALMMAQKYYCVLGSDSKIKENQKLFSRIIQVFE